MRARVEKPQGTPTQDEMGQRTTYDAAQGMQSGGAGTVGQRHAARLARPPQAPQPPCPTKRSATLSSMLTCPARRPSPALRTLAGHTVRVGAAEDVHVGAPARLLLGQDDLHTVRVVGVGDGVALPGRAEGR
jgi:hypothetical protein